MTKTALMAAALGLLGAVASWGGGDEGRPYAGKITDLLEAHPLEDRSAPQVTPLAAGKGSSVALIQTTSPVKLHRHESHDETVLVWRGKGRMRLGEKTHPVGPGSILYIPRGTLHSFVPEGEEKAVALSSFSPPFDGKDRVFVPEDE